MQILTLTHDIRLLLAAAAAVAAALTDLRSRLIPNRLTLPALAAGLLLAVAGGGMGWAGLGGAAAGAAAFGVPLLLFWAAAPEAVGAGDVKLGFALGALLGFPLALSALVLGTAAAAAFSLALCAWAMVRTVPRIVAAWRQQGLAALAIAVHDPVWRYPLPYGSFLRVATLAALALAIR